MIARQKHVAIPAHLHNANVDEEEGAAATCAMKCECGGRCWCITAIIIPALLLVAAIVILLLDPAWLPWKGRATPGSRNYAVKSSDESSVHSRDTRSRRGTQRETRGQRGTQRAMETRGQRVQSGWGCFAAKTLVSAAFLALVCYAVYWVYTFWFEICEWWDPFVSKVPVEQRRCIQCGRPGCGWCRRGHAGISGEHWDRDWLASRPDQERKDIFADAYRIRSFDLRRKFYLDLGLNEKVITATDRSTRKPLYGCKSQRKLDEYRRKGVPKEDQCKW